MIQLQLSELQVLIIRRLPSQNLLKLSNILTAIKFDVKFELFKLSLFLRTYISLKDFSKFIETWGVPVNHLKFAGSSF